jgi:plasmid maintenance system antidote protein VapI
MRKQKTPLEALRAKIKALGSQSAVARELGITRAYMSDIVRGRRGISPRIANSLGFKKRVVFEVEYEPIRKR